MGFRAMCSKVVDEEIGKRGTWLFYYTDGKMKWKKEVTGRGKEVDRGRRGTLVNKKNETDEVDLRCALLKARDHDENLIEFSMCSRSSMCFRKICEI